MRTSTGRVSALPGGGGGSPRAPALYRLGRVAFRLLARSPANALLDVPASRALQRRLTATRVTDADTVEILRALMAAGCRVWMIGGWGCDALLGRQTRPHADLDLVIPRSAEHRALQTLARLGFATRRQYDLVVLGRAIELLDRRRRRKVTLHLVDLDPGSGDRWEASLRAAMRAEGLDRQEVFATGHVNGDRLPCVSAGAQLLLHTGYDADDVDRRDVGLLCTRFALPPPQGYTLAVAERPAG